MISFNVPPFTGREIEYIKDCVESRKICGDGKYTKKCNEWIEKKTGAAKCLLTTSCTHATEMAALLSGIKEGDEVIMPSYSYSIFYFEFVFEFRRQSATTCGKLRRAVIALPGKQPCLKLETCPAYMVH